MTFSSRFGQGSIIGVHLDTWHGTLTFFKNRKCIGEGAFLTRSQSGTGDQRWSIECSQAADLRLSRVDR